MGNPDLLNWKISNFLTNKNLDFNRQEILKVLPDKSSKTGFKVPVVESLKPSSYKVIESLVGI